MKLEHTPGPWSTTGNNNGFNDANGGAVPHSSSFIEDAYCETDATPESMANDRLIAAAPEMLEALIESQKHDAVLFGGVDTDYIKIIEKATGRTWEELNA